MEGTPGPVAVRAIGVHPLVQYLVQADGGRLQTYPLAWDVERGEWFDVFEHDPRAPGDWGHWSGRALTWNSMCAACHVTRMEKRWDAQSDVYDSTFLELGVGCEACHGPAAAHAAAPEAHTPQPPTHETCAPCHARRSALTEPFEASDAFLSRFAPALPDLGDGWYPDGQVRDEDFEWASFTTSRMAQVGVGCGDCHAPHTGALVRDGDALCLGCHSALPGFEAHDHHSGHVGCADCHMRTTTYMERHPRRDHGFLHPDPVLGLELDLPDACSGCHSAAGEASARSRDDLAATWEGWYGDHDRARRTRARAIAAARRGAPEAPAAVLGALAQESHPAWRAILLGVAAPWAHLPEVRRALAEGLASPEDLVRFAAADALAASASDPREVASVLDPALRDPVAAVRVAAARGLRGAYPPDHPQMADLATHTRLERDQPAGALAWGGWMVERGELAAGITELQRGIAWDPNAGGMYHTLAVALSASGRPEDARAQLRTAVSRSPSEPELWHALGLAEASLGDSAAASEALEQACKLDPTRMRSWYNLGLLRHSTADGDGAVAALEQAARLDAGVDAAWALATVQRDLGRHDAARGTASSILARDPSHADAAALLLSLPRQ
ncbi:MAG: putative CXXCH cytochrome family protein [Myxococcota bacterium]|jgi:predicted CXXCH cytochrome family protein